MPRKLVGVKKRFVKGRRDTGVHRIVTGRRGSLLG